MMDIFFQGNPTQGCDGYGIGKLVDELSGESVAQDFNTSLNVYKLSINIYI